MQQQNANFSQIIIEVIQEIFGPGPVSLHQPSFLGNEWSYVKDAIDSTFVSSVGPYVSKFETELAGYTGAKHVIAVTNGTAALHLALLLAGVSRNDEVLIPALTFVATANAVSYCGAIPHFIDSEDKYLGLNVEKLAEYLEESTIQLSGNCVNKKTGRIIRAIVPMHTFGHPCNMEKIMSLASRFHLKIVEDAAEGLGSFFYGKHVGTFGELGVLSFNGNKIITTGGGGAILTNNDFIALRAKHLSTTAKINHPWEYIHDDIGFNYRLPNINAALGLAQLELMSEFLENKRRLNQIYKDKLSGLNIAVIGDPPGCASNFWLQTLDLKDSSGKRLNLLLAESNAVGISTRPIWRLLNTLDPYINCPAMNVEVAERLTKSMINIPSSALIRPIS